MSLDRQIVVRVGSDLHGRLVADGKSHGRTVAQSVRFHLNQVLSGGASTCEGEESVGSTVTASAANGVTTPPDNGAAS